MSRWTIQYKRGPSHGIAIPTDPLYSPTVPTDPLRARAALLKQAFVPGVEKGVRSLVAEEGAEDDGELALSINGIWAFLSLLCGRFGVVFHKNRGSIKKARTAFTRRRSGRSRDTLTR